MKISPRRAILIIWGASASLSIILLIQYLVAPSPLVEPWVALVTFPVSALLWIIYWRGGDYARYLNVIFATLMSAFIAPLNDLNNSHFLPLFVIVPAIVALVFANSAWILISSMLMWVILLWRVGPTGLNFAPEAFGAYFVATLGLILGRAISDAAQRESAVNAALAHQQADEIRQLNAQLEERVRNRTAQLEAANKELEAFSYSISHDLRAPLRSILGFTAILTDDHAAEFSPETKHFLDRIAASGTQMNNLIDGLLEFSRLNQKKLQKQPVDMNQLVSNAIETLALETAHRQIEWRLSELPPATADPLLLQQVYTNLIGNAVKYTRRNPNACIEVGSTLQDSVEVYYVKDNGVGFEMQLANKLFGVFQRLHHEKDFEGLGIGLATVQRIILRHEGRIWAEAAVDQGATFYFTLG